MRLTAPTLLLLLAAPFACPPASAQDSLTERENALLLADHTQPNKPRHHSAA